MGNCAFAMEFTAEQLNDKEIAKGLFLDFMNDGQRVCSISLDNRNYIVWEDKKTISEKGRSIYENSGKAVYKPAISKAGMPFLLNEIKTNLNANVPLYSTYVNQIDLMLQRFAPQ